MSQSLYDISSSCMCSIYIIKNSINNKVYVGQTWRSIKRRFQIHLQSSTYSHCIKFRRAVKKYGVDKFSIELLTFCHSQKMADYYETFFIRKFNSIKNGYNILEFSKSRKGIKHSLKTKKNMSISRTGINNSNSILKLWQVKQIRLEYKDYKNPKTGSKYGVITALSKKYNTSVSNIFDIVKDRKWK